MGYLFAIILSVAGFYILVTKVFLAPFNSTSSSESKPNHGKAKNQHKKAIGIERGEIIKSLDERIVILDTIRQNIKNYRRQREQFLSENISESENYLSDLSDYDEDDVILERVKKLRRILEEIR